MPLDEGHRPLRFGRSGPGATSRRRRRAARRVALFRRERGEVRPGRWRASLLSVGRSPSARPARVSPDSAPHGARSGPLSGRHRDRVEGARDHVLPDERIVPRAVVLGRQSEHGRVRSGPVREIAGICPLWLTRTMNLAIAGPTPSAPIGLVDVHGRGQRRLRSGSTCGRRLATRIRTCSGWRPTRSEPRGCWRRDPPVRRRLAVISRCRSSACSAGVDSEASSVFRRPCSTPRGS